MLRKRHLAEQRENTLALTIVGGVRLSHVAISVGMVIDVRHSLSVKRTLRHLADASKSSHVARTDTFRMNTQILRIVVAYLMHHALKVEHVAIFTSLGIVGEHDILVLTSETRKNGDAIVLVNDTRLSRYDAVGEEKLGAETMDVSHEYILNAVVRDVASDALHHTTGCAIGERQAQHVLISHALLLVGITYTLCKNVCLATSRRCKHKMKTAACRYHFSLTWVWNKRLLHIIYW